MAKAELKTQPTDRSFDDFLRDVPEDRQADCIALDQMMRRASGHEPTIWGSIVGYGHYDYKYKSGREGSWFITGFSPRARNLTVYIMPGFKRYAELLERLGPHKKSVSCLYLTRLERVDLAVLEELIGASCQQMQEIYNSNSQE